MSKQKQPSTQVPLQTRAASMSSKLATMAATAPSNSSLHADTFDSEAVSMSNLISVLDNQRASLREDMHTPIQESISPLQASVDNLRATVNTFQGRLASAESLADENFERLSRAETSIKKLQAENATLWDKLDNMENRACRSNLRIVNVPEGIEDGQDPVKFVSGMLNEIMGDVFDKSLASTEAQTRRPPQKLHRVFPSTSGKGACFTLGQAARAEISGESPESISRSEYQNFEEVRCFQRCQTCPLPERSTVPPGVPCPPQSLL